MRERKLEVGTFKYRYVGGYTFCGFNARMGDAVSMFEKLAVPSFDSIDWAFYRNT